jgi:predicted dehydrogenase
MVGAYVGTVSFPPSGQEIGRRRDMSRDFRKIGRRDFLRKAGENSTIVGMTVLAAGCITAAKKKPPKVTEPTEPTAGKLVPPGKKIGTGFIGVGGQGTYHLKEMVKRAKEEGSVEVKAVCDIYEPRKARAKAISNADVYHNYRDLLAREDIDAVVIASPDHWHAQMSLDALDAGKDVYVEKPFTYTIDEARRVRDKVLETGRILQCGSQSCSEDFWWQARAFIKEGGIGKVLWIQGDYSRNSGSESNPQGGEWNWTIEPSTSRENLDWDAWLGPAPKRPFSKPRYFQFRKFWDYSGGIATDLLYHILAPMTIGLDATFPERVTASGGIYVQHDDREVPDTYMSQLDYPDDYTIVLTSSMANRQGLPTIIRGHFATIYGDGRVVAEDEFKNWFKKRYGAEEIKLASQPRMGHMDNFLHCVRTRQKPHCDAETAYRAMVGIRLGVDSYRQDSVMFFDPKTERQVSSHPRPTRTSKFPAVQS